MANRVQRKITQTRNVLIVVIAVCAAKLAKIIMDGGAQTTQIVVLSIVIVVLGVVLGLYILVDRYTQKEQAEYGQQPEKTTPAVPADAPRSSLKDIYKEIFKKR